MRIDGLSPQPKVSQAQERNTTDRSKKTSDRPDDVVEISRSGQDVSTLSTLAKSAPAEANPRIQEIRGRVESGYYNSRQVREQIADSLLESENLREVVSEINQVQVAKQQLSEIPDIREDRVDTARQRVGSGFYDESQVRQDTADRVLDELA